LPVPEKEALLERIDRLRKAVQEARSRANATEVERKKIGEVVFGYLLG
jgi:hypothetical protein